MLSYEVYRFVHFLSIAFVITALGGAAVLSLSGENVKEHAAKKIIGITHGAGMIGVLVGGFGMLARLGLDGLPGWIYAKLGLWFVVGAVMGVAMRVPGAGKLLWFVVPLLVAVTGYIATAKPF
ncbi:MAG: hypothetical protein GY898_18370 [Proteobacteria bacterium]|nr:hypothetical protein [Pseudomonadota bacterium]